MSSVLDWNQFMYINMVPFHWSELCWYRSRRQSICAQMPRHNFPLNDMAIPRNLWFVGDSAFDDVILWLLSIESRNRTSALLSWNLAMSKSLVHSVSHDEYCFHSSQLALIILHGNWTLCIFTVKTHLISRNIAIQWFPNAYSTEAHHQIHEETCWIASIDFPFKFHVLSSRMVILKASLPMKGRCSRRLDSPERGGDVKSLRLRIRWDSWIVFHNFCESSAIPVIVSSHCNDCPYLVIEFSDNLLEAGLPNS
jgi:hypothetical protein